ncbi:MAG TPA: hypothetical protein VFA65_16080 [Bryobacteraceae bacterium]|nr:hypothetical protein [Bryobacteraceae bacterium]
MIEIDREHVSFQRQKQTLQMYRDLYAGGNLFKERVAHYLLRRQKEPLDVYAERLSRVFYENYIGSIIDWYGSTLFRREPSLYVEDGPDSGQQFLAQFSDDCDRRGTRLSDFLRQSFIDALVAGKSHILIDFPRTSKQPANRAEEDAAGISRAYLVRYQAEDLINWCVDERGDYEWLVFRQKCKQQATIESSSVVEETWWRYYDKSEYRLYRRIDNTQTPGAIELIAQGPHALTMQDRVPVVTLELSEGLRLMSKAAHLQLEHFNKSNSLGWAITMGLFAMPVIYSDREWDQIVGESYYIQLGPSDRFGWTEPDGKVYQIAASNLETLKEEIYRVCYLSQASGEMISGRAQSASSKQMDFTITQEVLRGYGSAVKDCIRRIITAITDARQDRMAISVTGLDEVDISDFTTELQNAASLLSLGIESPTLKREICQRLALKYLYDARQEIKDQIAREIGAQYVN